MGLSLCDRFKAKEADVENGEVSKVIRSLGSVNRRRLAFVMLFYLELSVGSAEIELKKEAPGDLGGHTGLRLGVTPGGVHLWII